MSTQGFTLYAYDYPNNRYRANPGRATLTDQTTHIATTSTNLTDEEQAALDLAAKQAAPGTGNWDQARETLAAAGLESPERLLRALGDDGDLAEWSARTGLPTVLGSPHHELQWRGSADGFGEREHDINLIYESVDIGQVEALLEKYDVTYVYVGDLERQQYGAEVGEKFARFMDVVFENEGVTIYQVGEE